MPILNTNLILLTYESSEENASQAFNAEIFIDFESLKEFILNDILWLDMHEQNVDFIENEEARLVNERLISFKIASYNYLEFEVGHYYLGIRKNYNLYCKRGSELKTSIHEVKIYEVKK
jgi:hypothetical protein